MRPRTSCKAAAPCSRDAMDVLNDREKDILVKRRLPRISP
jgi:hypothetical protein